MCCVRLLRLVVWLLVVIGCRAGFSLAVENGDGLPLDIVLLQEGGQPGADGNAVAEAWKRVVGTGPRALSPLVVAARKAEPVARNWLLSAADQIVAQEHAAGREIPKELIVSILNDVANHPHARWWAYEWLQRQDAAYARQILGAFLDDPGPELRRAAIAAEMESLGDLKTLENVPGDNPQRKEVVEKLRRLFDAARDGDQVEELARVLRQFGEQVDLAAHYGYIATWWLIGPFDNREDVGFDAVYPPERRAGEPDLAASYPGKHGPVAWKKVTTPDEHGAVDLNKILGEEKGVVAYAAASIVSDSEQPAQIRVATPNAIKVWGNGQALGAFHVYHSGFEDDQYRLSWRLQKGVNWILIKVSQNEQTQDWARFWTFRLRVCDELGGGLARPPE
ncbi:MAG: hypothetical protein ACUVQG_03745 [Thermogutta sp.]